jgi:integrase
VIEDGVAVRKQSCTLLAPICDEYPSKRSVLLLAQKILEPINSKSVQPESSMPVVDFITNYYLPFVQKTLRASTFKDYSKDIFERHLRHRLKDYRLRDFRTVHGQRIITSIGSTESDVGHKTLQRIKSFMSGVFKHAKREGFVDGENPMRDVSVMGKPKKFKGEIYTLDEIDAMFAVLPEPAKTVVATAAFTGLRLAELRGLKWSDFNGETLRVNRTIWRTAVGKPKTDSSEDAVPVLTILQAALNRHRKRVNGKDDDFIFAGSRKGGSLNLPNLVRRVIIPAFNACYRNEKPRWKGWHGFRRGLASNLYSMGVEPVVLQSILRHSDVSTTLEYYVKTDEAKRRDAIQRMEHEFFFLEDV